MTQGLITHCSFLQPSRKYNKQRSKSTIQQNLVHETLTLNTLGQDRVKKWMRRNKKKQRTVNTIEPPVIAARRQISVNLEIEQAFRVPMED